MDKRLEENLDKHADELTDIGAKVDLALELLERIATGGGNVQAQELEDWKRRCRARAQERRERRRRKR